jgi:hypothetical protein
MLMMMLLLMMLLLIIHGSRKAELRINYKNWVIVTVDMYTDLDGHVKN